MISSDKLEPASDRKMPPSQEDLARQLDLIQTFMEALARKDRLIIMSSVAFSTSVLLIDSLMRGPYSEGAQNLTLLSYAIYIFVCMFLSFRSVHIYGSRELNKLRETPSRPMEGSMVAEWSPRTRVMEFFFGGFSSVLEFFPPPDRFNAWRLTEDQPFDDRATDSKALLAEWGEDPPAQVGLP